MQQFFNAIVHLLEAVCRYSGFRYSEINILIYCLLVPALWCGIVWYRSRKSGWLLLFFLALSIFYVWEKHRFLQFSINFYNKNIVALEKLGEGTGLGYVGISLLIGVIIPFLFSLALVFIPKQRVRNRHRPFI